MCAATARWPPAAWLLCAVLLPGISCRRVGERASARVGARNSVPVAIALENGILPNEIHRTYVRAKRGLLGLEMHGRWATVRFFSHPVATTAEKTAYELQREINVRQDRISFMNDLGQLRRARKELLRLLPAWSSFDGLMVHELIGAQGRKGGRRVEK